MQKCKQRLERHAAPVQSSCVLIHRFFLLTLQGQTTCRYALASAFLTYLIATKLSCIEVVHYEYPFHPSRSGGRAG